MAVAKATATKAAAAAKQTTMESYCFGNLMLE